VSDIRVAITGDASALAVLEERSSVASLGHLFGPHPYPSDDVLARWTLVLQDPDVTVLGAWDGDALVGFAAIDPGSLRPLRGVAGALRHRAGRRAARARRRAVARSRHNQGELWVLAQNTRARRFYERHGWTADGRAQESQWPPYPVEVAYVLDVSTG
jgi:hypothetical protein